MDPYILNLTQPEIFIPILSSLALIITLVVSYVLNLIPGFPLLEKNLSNFSAKLQPVISWINFILALIWALAIYLYALTTGTEILTFLIRLYGLTAMFMLFLILTPGLFRVYFPRFPLNDLIIKGRRSLGISMFFFALAHAGLAFFHIYRGSIQVILHSKPTYQVAFFFGLLALIIFLAMATTASDFMLKKLTFKRWKTLHRLIYIGAIFVLLHAFLRGSDFAFRQQFLPFLMAFLSLYYIQLEMVATLKEMILLKQKKVVIFMTILIMSMVLFASFYITMISFSS